MSSGSGVPAQAAALAELAFGASLGRSAVTLPTPGAAAVLAGGDGALDLDLDDPQQSHFGDYTLLAKLGQGGMGVVYRAHQHSLKREVALKLLAAGPWASPGFIERFRFEAQSAARMQHPNIITIFEAGAQDGLPFFSMRYVRGQSLAERIRQRGALPPKQAAQLLRTVAEAVDYAHRLGVLHLDLKPGNVLLDEQGQPMVADFGLARHIEQAAQGGADEVSGTPSYMAPEQATLCPPLSPATDVYALGATLFEALTARPPFRGATARETLQQVVVGMPPSLRSIDRRLPLDLQAICMKCLEKDPARRYADARALAEDLGRYLEGREVLARPLNLAGRAARLIRREPRLSALAALFLLALLIGTVATALQWLRAEDNAVDARENLWRTRTLVAQAALADGDGFRGLRQMVDNLQEMEAAGRIADAQRERQRIGTLLANAPQPIEIRMLPSGESITSVAISPDASRVAIALHEADGTRMVRQYAVDSGEELWSTVTEGLSHGLPHGSGMPHGWLRYTPSGRLLLAGLTQQPPFAAPSGSDTIALHTEDGAPLVPPTAVGDFADILYSGDGSTALLRLRSESASRFPDLLQLYRPQDWTALGPRRHNSELGGAVDFQLLPDGSALLATADFVRFALHEVPALNPRWELAVADGEQVRAWRFSEDGGWLALGTVSGRVHLVSTADGRSRQLVSALASAVRWLEFEADSSLLSALGEDGSLMVWQVADGRPRSQLIASGGRGLGRVVLQHGSLYAAAEERLRRWQLTLPAPFDLAALPAAAQLRSRRVWWAHGFAVHAPTRLLASGGADGTLGLWREPPPALTGWRAAPLPSGTLRFDGRRIATVDAQDVLLRDVDTGAVEGPALHHPEPLRLAEFDASGRWLVTIAGRTVRVIDPQTGALQGEPVLLPQTPLRAEIAAAAPVLAVTTGEYVGNTFHERLHVIDLVESRLREGHWRVPGIVERFQLSPDGRRALLFAVTWPMVDNDVLLVDLDAEAGRCHRLPIEDPHWPVEAEFAADGRSAWLTVTLEDRVTRVARWDLRDCRMLASHEIPSSGAFKKLRAAGDRVVVSALAGDEISIIDGDGQRSEFPALPRFQVMFDMAVSSDGLRAAQATRNSVLLFDLERGERLSGLLSAPIAGNDSIAKLAFSPDASRLLARTYQGNWLLWELPRSGHPVETLALLAELLDPDADDVQRSAAAAAQLRPSLRGEDPGPPGTPQAPVRRLSYAALPGAATDPRFLPLDLRPLLNVPLAGAWPVNPGMGGDKGTLAPGPQRLNDIDWRIDGGIQLAGGSYGSYFNRPHPDSGLLEFPPLQVRRVHVIVMRHVPHAPHEQARHQADVVLIGVDGREHALPIFHIRDVVQHARPNAMPANGSRGRIAWTGAHSSVVRDGMLSSSHTPSQIYSVALDVPPDAGAIRGLRLRVAPGPIEAPLFHAVTLERAAAPPAP